MIVAGLLQFISIVTGLTYKEVNIIVYYFVIPLCVFSLLDSLVQKSFFKGTFLVISVLFFLFLKDFREFSEQLFDKSVEFLMSFKAIGWDYVTASVIVCVIFPVALFFALRYFINRNSKNFDCKKDKAMQKTTDKELTLFFVVFILLALISIKSAGLGLLAFPPKVGPLFVIE